MERQPASLRVATALVGVEGIGLGVFGLVELLRALLGHPHDRGTAVLLGVVLLIYASGILAIAWFGLRLAKRRAQTPTYLVQFFSIVIGIGQVHTVPWLAIPLLAVAVAAFVAVSMPDSREALGGI